MALKLSISFFKILFIYSLKTWRGRERKGERDRQRHRQREKQDPCRKPDVGLDPGVQGSHPEPKADAQPLSHPGAPANWNLNKNKNKNKNPTLS